LHSRLPPFNRITSATNLPPPTAALTHFLQTSQ
jgi:hypothetical protein